MASGNRLSGDVSVAAAQSVAAAAGLHYVTDAEPGIRRIRERDPFRYEYLAAGRHRTGGAAGINNLAGRLRTKRSGFVESARARKRLVARRAAMPLSSQVTCCRDGTKFARMTEFAAALPDCAGAGPRPQQRRAAAR
jgi:DNA topoisomerase IB